MTTQEPTSPDPLINYQVHVTPEQVADLTQSVNKLHRDLRTRAIGFLVALILIVIVGAALTVIGYRSEHFLHCQAAQNTEFRQSAATERAAQRALFNVILNPASNETDRYKATQAYYTGLVAADQQRTDVGAC
jgi:uncharacterized protein YpmS